MSSNFFFLLIVITIFGLAGVKFLIRANNMSQQSDQTNSKIDGLIKNTKMGINFIVGGWFVIFVIIVIYLSITRLP